MFCRKGNSVVVALILLVIITVGGILTFQADSQRILSDLLASKQQDIKGEEISIERVAGNTVFIEAPSKDTVTVKSITVNGSECLNTGPKNLSGGFDDLSLENCSDPKGIQEVVIVTNRGVFTSTHYFKEPGEPINTTPTEPAFIAIDACKQELNQSGMTYLLQANLSCDFAWNHNTSAVNVTIDGQGNSITLNNLAVANNEFWRLNGDGTTPYETVTNFTLKNIHFHNQEGYRSLFLEFNDLNGKTVLRNVNVTGAMAHPIAKQTSFEQLIMEDMFFNVTWSLKGKILQGAHGTTTHPARIKNSTFYFNSAAFSEMGYFSRHWHMENSYFYFETGNSPMTFKYGRDEQVYVNNTFVAPHAYRMIKMENDRVYNDLNFTSNDFYWNNSNASAFIGKSSTGATFQGTLKNNYFNFTIGDECVDGDSDGYCDNDNISLVDANGNTFNLINSRACPRTNPSC